MPRCPPRWPSTRRSPCATRCGCLMSGSPSRCRSRLRSTPATRATSSVSARKSSASGASRTPILPAWLDFTAVRGLSNEVRQRLLEHRPATLGQAARIPGVTPAAVSLLLVHLKRGAACRDEAPARGLTPDAGAAAANRSAVDPGAARRRSARLRRWRAPESQDGKGSDGQAAIDVTTLRRGNGPEPDSLDPQRARTDSSLNVIRDLFEGLTAVGGDGKPVAAAAESWTVSADGREYRFRLREGLRWSNGDPLVAGDFVVGMRRLVDPATASQYAQILEPVVNAAAIVRGRATTIRARRRWRPMLGR